MKAPWKFALLALVAMLFAAAAVGPPSRDVEAAPTGIEVRVSDCTLFPLPPLETEVTPGEEYCITFYFSGITAAGQAIEIEVDGATGGSLAPLACFGGWCGAPSGSGYARSYTTVSGVGGGFGIIDAVFTLTDCTDPVTVSSEHLATPLELELDCNATGPAPTVGLTLYPGTCAGLPVPLPTPVTTVAPDTDYCLVTVASDHIAGDTHTVTSAGVGGEIFDILSCFTNSAGFDPCTDPTATPPVDHPAPGGSPFVIPIPREDSNSFLGMETDFDFTACEESTLTLTYSYDGPGLEPASAMASYDCLTEPPTVTLDRVLPGICSSITFPLPPSQTTLSPDTDYCIWTGTSDHVAGDSHTLMQAGAGGDVFDLSVCATNSAGFDPCTDPTATPPVGHPGPGASPYVMPILREDPNSFILAETNFRFTACDESIITLTYSYDGPGLPAGSDMESFDCVEEVIPPAPEGFAKYTDAEDEVLDPGESFEWFIDVPGTSAHWTVIDVLPHGFFVDGPLPEGCWQLFGRLIVCSGEGGEPMTLTLPVSASTACGTYANTAKLITLFGLGFELATDEVSVEGCAAGAGGGAQPGGNFWDRLWGWIR